MRSIITVVTLCGLHAAQAAESSLDRDPAELLKPYIPAVSMESDRRTAPGALTRDRIGKSGIGARAGATGLIRCGGAVGTAQLTLRTNVITTAAHVLIGNDGQPRTSCTFQSIAGGAPIPIEPRSISAGSRAPMAEPATRDWAVARLARPVPGVTPYGIASPGVTPSGVFMVAGGNRRPDAMGAERCNTRGVIASAPEGVREFAIDCNAAPGSSGAAVTAGHRIVGIYVGYRSVDPGRAQAFSSTHYNFAITLEGPFRRALLATAR
jgi:hypothetical protein